MTDLLALEKRLGEAGEGSRELDAVLLIHFGMSLGQKEHFKQWCRWHSDPDLTTGQYAMDHAPKYTTSLDAALALAERKLTECRKSRADILNWILEAMEEVGSGNIVSAFALAICLALVRAIAHNPAVEK